MRSTAQISSSRQEVALKLLNVQQTFNGILETLERIEALEGFQRDTPLARNREGDANHTELNTNLLALDLRLKCMNMILGQYNDKHFNSECFRNLSNWHNKSSQSSLITNLCIQVREALLESYEFRTQPEPVTEKDMAESLSGLAKGTKEYQDQILIVEGNPEGYIRSDQMYKIREPTPTPSLTSKPPSSQVRESGIQSNQRQNEDPKQAEESGITK